MSAFNSARRKLRRLLIGSVAATAVATIAIAANPGLPFTEQFLDTNERDATVTTADWGITTAGVLQLAAEASLENLSLSGAAMGDGLSSPTTRGIALGDFDGDGDLDAAVANENNEINLVYENTGGSFSTAPTNLGTLAARSRSIKAGDIDLDGDIDLVVGNFQGNIVWHENDGTGTFADAVNISSSSGKTWPIELVDFDGDGDLDVIDGQDNPNTTNRIYRNSAANTSNVLFTAEDLGTELLDTRSLAVGDIDGDGWLDLVTGDHNSNNHIYYGDGDGGVDPGVVVQSAQIWNTFALALADLNGDGALDLVEGVQRDQNNLNGETKVYLNNGAGGFLAPSNLTGSNTLHTTVALVLRDFDKDGDIDILEGNNGGWDHDNDGNTADIAQPNRLFLNDGAANFTAGPELTIATVNEQTYAMEAGDLDGDGILDFVTGNQTGDNAAYSLAGDTSANPAVQQLTGVAQSTRVDDATQGNVRFARIQVDSNDISVPGLSSIEFFLTNDDGVTWVPAPLDRPVEFPSARVGPIKWRADISTSSPTQLPTLSKLTVATNESFPSFNGPETFSGQQGQELTPVQVDFTDADGDRLTYTLSGLPSNSGMSIDGNTGIISGTPNASDAAAAPITLTAGAYDGVRFRTGTMTFTTGSGGNQQPTVATSIPDQSATEGVAFSLDASGNFSDPEGANLSYAATGFPASITMNAAGVASGTPGAADVGSWNVTVTATDPGGLFVQDTFALTVASGNQAPVLNPSIGAHSGTVGTAVNIDVSGNFSDPDGDALTFSGTGAPSSLSISAAGVVSGTPVAADVGTHSITITATDPGGLSASDTFVLTISEAAPPPPPPPPPPPSSGGGGGSLNLWELVAAALLFAGIGIHRRRQRGQSIMVP